MTIRCTGVSFIFLVVTGDSLLQEPVWQASTNGLVSILFWNYILQLTFFFLIKGQLRNVIKKYNKKWNWLITIQPQQSMEFTWGEDSICSCSVVCNGHSGSSLPHSIKLQIAQNILSQTEIAQFRLFSE